MKIAALACLAFAALALAACDDSRRAVAPASAQSASPTMPPARVAACLESALVDEKCTKIWYACSADRSTCSRQWAECCRASTSPD